MTDRPKTADVPRREPVYEPEDTVRFPTAGNLEGAHTDVDGVRETATGYVGPADRQLAVTLLNISVIVPSTNPVLCLHGTPGGQSRGGKRKSVSIFNKGAQTIYVAGTESACSVGNGFPIPASTGFTWDKEPNGDIWVLAETGTCDVRMMIEQGYLGGDN